MSSITIRPLLTLVALAWTVVAFGQAGESDVLEDQDLSNARALLQAGRADIIREELRLSDEESAGFWPIYEEYHADIMVVRDRQTKAIGEFLRIYKAGAASNEYAERLVEDNFKIRSDLLKIQEKYVRQFRKVLSALKVARFYQLESQMDAQVDAQLALFVPLVEST